VFIHDYSLLIDTSEDIVYQLNRSNIQSVKHATYSHWHGDHVLGYRVWYTLNYDFGEKAEHRTTTIHVPFSHERREVNFGHLEYLSNLRKKGLVHIEHYESTFAVGDLLVTSFPLGDSAILGFLLAEGDKRVLIIMDDTFGWTPDAKLKDADLAILPIGLFDVHPVTGERLMTQQHPLLADEATFSDVINLIEVLSPKQVCLSHIEEHDHIGFDSFAKINQKFAVLGKKVFCATDAMLIQI
jgi:phosphoribosyl 1,2-cyclic phosphate phosphodiesterase